MDHSVEAFYDGLSPAFVRDYVKGNKRIERQFGFFQAAIERDAESLLVIGCGSGQGAHHIATRIAKDAEILAVDISGANIELAYSLFPHPNIQYRKCDVLTEVIDGKWNVIVLPDVYEHIPQEARRNLHARLNQLLAPEGRILLTIPSEQTQKSLHDPQNKRHTPQIIDEVVTLADLVCLAEETDATLTYFASISVWQSNDYVHAIVERGADRAGSLRRIDSVPIKAGSRSGVDRMVRSLRKKLGFNAAAEWRRRRRVARLTQKP